MVSTPLAALFGQSPIRPIQAHIAKAHECCEVLVAFFNAALNGDWEKAASTQQEIAALENEADNLKKEIRLQLPKGLFMPVPRADLLELVRMQDKIANTAKDISGLMLGRKMQFPAPIAEQMTEYVASAVATSAQAVTAINEMQDLLEAGFRGREVEVVEQLIHQLEDLEHKNDELQVNIRAKLFTLESELPPVDVMFMYKIIEWVGDLADRAEKVGARLELLLAK